MRLSGPARAAVIALFLLCFFLASAAFAQELVLSEAEKAFLEQHKVIRMGVDPSFVPFEFIDSDGGYKGIAAEYVRIMEGKLGVRFEAAKGLTWPEAYSKALEGDLDVLPSISQTPERERYFLFSRPYYNFKRVIVTRTSQTDINDIEDLYGKTVAVQRNSSHHSYLIGHPAINLSLYDSWRQPLPRGHGTETAFVGNLAPPISSSSPRGLPTSSSWLSRRKSRSPSISPSGRTGPS
jgi:ABC-type amino acid transport substrate-binding protein